MAKTSIFFVALALFSPATAITTDRTTPFTNKTQPMDATSATRDATPPATKARLPGLGRMNMATIPINFYRQDCGHNTQVGNPGAGIGKVSVNEKVLKDGFYKVDCAKDYMYEHGDKYGDNKHSYDLGDVSGVSIVHYSKYVSGLDAEPMTLKVCFKFCRTVPDMNFFGLIKGRECYCTPYYKPMAGDSSMCDAPCDGDAGTFCGGMTKSLIFSMHACGDTKSNVADAAQKLTDVKTDVTALGKSVAKAAKSMQSLADTMQPAFGKVGDSAISGLLQDAKVFAGKLDESAGKAKKLDADMAELVADAKAVADGGDITSVDATAAAEKLTESMEISTAKGESIIEDLEAVQEKAHPVAATSSASADTYYPVLYFIDKKYKDVPSTCGGDLAGEPLMGTLNTCAATCDATKRCTGFSYVTSDGADGICFLLSKVKSTTYYTGCGGPALLQQKPLFLQQGQNAGTHAADAGSDTVCKVKFSDFDGMTLKPDPSGKCEQCLDKATKADRCYQ